MKKQKGITLSTLVERPIQEVWTYWTTAEHVIQWNNASEDWYTPAVEIDFREGGKFNYTMAAIDDSREFNFEGTYTKIKANKVIEYTITDGRKVKIEFLIEGQHTKIIETFEPESINPVDMQAEGWQAILDNFKNYVED